MYNIRALRRPDGLEEWRMWTRLGLNAQHEWVEEHSSGVRRVRTPEGYVEEHVPSMRFARVSSSSDALALCEALAYPTMLMSYASLRHAYGVWTTKKGQVVSTTTSGSDASWKGFRQRVELAMARRVWDAVERGVWSDDMPSWDGAIARVGLHTWPLGVDLGLRKICPLPSPLGMEEFSAWLAQQSVNNLVVSAQVLKGACEVRTPKNSWWILHPNLPASQVSWNAWVGGQPSLVPTDTWSTSYRAFSSSSNEVTGYVSPLLHQALHVSLGDENIQEDMQKWFGKDLNLSFDQQDAVWLAAKQLNRHGAFLLGDETGYGKGRVLAAIARLALQQNIQVLFVTEKKTLFSDFYRDCSAVLDTIPALQLLHQNAKVFSPSGEKIIATLHKTIPKGVPWVWTTYSQFNRKNEERMKSVKEWMKTKTWVILDEAQNAAGQSNTSDAVKKFTSWAKGVVFSSATFAKDENQLAVYQPLFEGTDKDWKRLSAAFGESNTVRTALTLEWAEQGSFIRREHPPMSLPDEWWVAGDSVRTEQELFATWWRAVYGCAQLWGASYHPTKGVWVQIGAHMARAQREFAMWQKKDVLIQGLLADPDKPVIVSDWTLSSHAVRLARAQLSDETADNDEVEIPLPKEGVSFAEKPLWKTSWLAIMDDLFPNAHLSMVAPVVAQKLKDAKLKIAQALLSLPNWSISPFDELKTELKKHGKRVGELSGRSWQLVQEDTWKIIPLPHPPRSQTILEFNSGELDALILTRAGNSGVSLHAGQTFKDQTKRHLIEWDVSPDPSVRLQFWGRVRRKDQVCEPRRSTLLVDNAFERRRQARDRVKQEKILAHTGSQVQTQVPPSMMKIVAAQWAHEHKQPAKVLDPYGEQDVGKLLARCVLLKEQDQVDLIDHMQEAQRLLEPLARHHFIWNNTSRVNRSFWWWGQEKSLFWEERVWPMVKGAKKEDIAVALKESTWLSSKEVISKWATHAAVPSVWQEYARSLEKGMGIVVRDPMTGQWAQAVVLGWRMPANNVWSPSCVQVGVWLATHDAPLVTSLLAVVGEGLLQAKTLGKPPSPTWFEGHDYPVTCMVLQGPAWSVAAWGERHAPQGTLLHLVNEDGTHGWGWRMPQAWSWEDAHTTCRELAGVDQAMEFFKFFPSQPITWTWRPNDCLTTTPQSDGIFVEGSVFAFEEHVGFPLRRKSSQVVCTGDRCRMIVPWNHARLAFFGWMGQGASPTVPSQHAVWIKKHWKQ